MAKKVSVLVGAGSIGQAIIRRVSAGKHVVLADYSLENAERAAKTLENAGFECSTIMCDLAKEEQKNGELPPFEGAVENIGQYDTVFIGGPVWWGTYPQVMFTFFKKYDLSGKTIIPFTTHEGSGLGSCVKDVKKAYPNATVTGEFSIYGHDVREGKSKVEKWLKKIGF